MYAFICISDQCNLACKYCFYEIGHLKRKNDILSINNFLKIACWLARVGFTGVSITGGEPTLVPHLIDCIKVLKNLGIYSNLVSNGTQLTLPLCKELEEAGLDSISISLDSLDAGTHNSCRGLFAETKEGYNNIMLSKIKDIEISLSVHRNNVQDTANFVSYFRNKGQKVCINFPYASPYSESTWSLENPLPLIIKMLRENNLDERDKIFLSSYKRFYETGYLDGKCKMGRSVFFIDSKGSLLPCPFRDDLKLNNYINLNRSDFLDTIDTQYTHISNRCLSRKCVNLFISKKYDDSKT